MKGNKQVKINSEVLVRFQDGFQGKYKIVYSSKADISKNIISAESPFGKVALGQTRGKKISYLNHQGKQISCRIIKIK